jgi:hypothetical protein
MLSGHVFRQALWAPATAGTAGGLLPTPVVADASNKESPEALRLRMQKYGRSGTQVHMKLSTAIQEMLPTPVARDWKGRSQRGDLLPDSFVPTGGGIYLNPSFVEEMMGFPVGWTV